jgi:hypothetical protein
MKNEAASHIEPIEVLPNVSPRETRNLVARINRRLRHSRERLYRTPEWQGFTPNGDFYIVNTVRRKVVQTHVDVEQLAREVGADYRAETFTWRDVALARERGVMIARGEKVAA